MNEFLSNRQAVGAYRHVPRARRATELALGPDARRGPVRATPEPTLGGLRVVLQECDRRAAVLRCLASVRWLALHGAEVMLFDGTATRASADGTAAAVRKRFPFVRVVPPSEAGVASRVHALEGSTNLLLDALAPLSADSAPPRWVLQLDADLEVDRFRVQGLLDELSGLPAGTILVPAVVGPEGVESRSRPDSAPQAWLARCSDLGPRSRMDSPVGSIRVRTSTGTSLISPRPRAS